MLSNGNLQFFVSLPTYTASELNIFPVYATYSRSTISQFVRTIRELTMDSSGPFLTQV